MQIDPALGPTAFVLALIFLFGLAIQFLRQPHVIGYIVVGVTLSLIGPDILSDSDVVQRLGSVGVTLLLFFVGMEIDPKGLIKGWKFSVGGTILQIVLSIALAFAIGYVFAWRFERSLLLGFVISLSSTAIALRMLSDWKLEDSRIGRDVLGVLIVQDMAAIIMIISIGFLAPNQIARDSTGAFVQIIGASLLLALLAWVGSGRSISFPFLKTIQDSEELQIYTALFICFGMSWLSATMGLSAALGAFAGGLIVGASRQTRWVSQALTPFRTVFVGLFFVSIGLLINVELVLDKYLQISLLVLAVLVSSMVVNTLMFKANRYDWRQSLLGGALLAQPGEFSFVLAAIGLTSGLLTGTGYQLSLAVIAISLAISPVHIFLVRMLVRPSFNQT